MNRPSSGSPPGIADHCRRRGNLAFSLLRTSILVALLFGAVAVPLAGQTSLTVHGGASIATIHQDGGSGGAGDRVGLTLGAAVMFPLRGPVGLRVGVGYVQKGARNTFPDLVATTIMDYIEAPVLLQLERPLTNSLSVHLLAGIALSYRLLCRGRSERSSGTTEVDCAENLFNTRETDQGGMAGGGITITATQGASVVAEALYNRGIYRFKVGSGDPKHRSLSLVAGLRIPIG